MFAGRIRQITSHRYTSLIIGFKVVRVHVGVSVKLYKVWWSYTSVYTRTVRIPQGRLHLVLRGVRVDGILAGGLAKLALLLHAGVVGDLANDLLRLADELVGNRGMACRGVVTTSVVSGRRIASIGGEA